jgi:pyridoxine/pyridoxamine 5'-phosphate oxidase
MEQVTAKIHGFSEPDSSPTPWATGLEQVRAADTFWLSTVRPDGRPHVTPLIAVWHADALWFVTGPEERKAVNLAQNPSCLVTTGRSDLAEGALDVVLEGRAEQVSDEEELRDGAFSDRGFGGRVIVFRLRPVRGLGFRKGDRFSQTTWRWT